MNDNTRKLMFSSKSDEWGTPQEFFDLLNKRYQFTLDAAASDKNHKCSNYYTLENSALDKFWDHERVFINPPYTKGQIKIWLEKAVQEVFKNDCESATFLIPARTDTRYFHDIIMKKAISIGFVKGRLKFVDGITNNSAPFPSMVVHFENKCLSLIAGQQIDLSSLSDCVPTIHKLERK